MPLSSGEGRARGKQYFVEFTSRNSDLTRTDQDKAGSLCSYKEDHSGKHKLQHRHKGIEHLDSAVMTNHYR